MPTRLQSGKKVVRVVKGTPKTVKVDELVVTVQGTKDGGLIEIRPMRHKQSVVIMVDKLFDDLMWLRAKQNSAKKA